MKKTVHCLGRIVRDCFRVYPLFAAAVFASETVNAAAGILNPVLLAYLLELAGGHGLGERNFILAVVWYGVCILLPSVTEVINGSLTEVAKVRGEKYFGRQMFVFSEKLRLEALEDPKVLDSFQKADSAVRRGGIQFEVLNGVIATAGALAGCVGTMAVVGRYSPLLAVSGAVGMLPALLSKMYFEKLMTRLRRRQSRITRQCGYFWGLFSDREAVKEMRVMGFEAFMKAKWQDLNIKRVREIREVQLDTGKKQAAGIFVQNLFSALNIGLAFYLMARGKISVGEFAACISAFAVYESCMVRAIVNYFDVAGKYHIAEDYYDYFTVPTEAEGSMEYRPFQEKVTAENVHFWYCGSDREALQGLNLEIKKGEHVVIVGENGSGKTTLSKLLAGAYLPCRGEIRFDGQSTEELKRSGLYAHVSVVSQDFMRYLFTLRENIGISALKRMSDTERMEALTKQVLDRAFLEKAGGLDVQLGREFGGVELSGGEWQKVAIARGLWKESDLIILDEPTSALDPLVEYEILCRFVEMTKGKTSVIISHRVGICRTADKIIVMKDGRVQECGRHEELLHAGGEYARLWTAQAKWYP